LALAPNRRRYRPGVLKRILSFSIPAGLIASVAVIASFAVLEQLLPLAEARSLVTITLFIVSLWVLSVLARPFSRARLVLIGSVTLAFALAFVVPLARDFFALEVPGLPGLGYAVGVGVVGAAGIEAWYRFARSRGLVSDRE
jgi:cation-transporting ATPase E